MNIKIWSSLRQPLGLILSIVLFALSPSIASAEGEYSAKDAKRFYITGMRYFNKGNYVVAEAQLSLASRLLPKTKRYQRAHTRLRYYLGLCYVEMKQPLKARPHLRAFLKKSKERSKLKKARSLLVEVDKQIALLPPPRRRPPVRRTLVQIPIKRPVKRIAPLTVVVIKRREVPKPTVAPPPRPWRAWPFVVTGVGLLAVAGGGVVGYLAGDKMSQRDNQFETLSQGMSPGNAPSSIEISNLHKQAELYAMIANGLYIGGGALTATGFVLILTMGRGPAPKTAKTNGQALSTKPLYPTMDQTHVKR